MKREGEWEAEKFEALNNEFQISNTRESGDWAEDDFASIDGWEKKIHFDNVTNALTRDSATIGQIREDKWNQFSFKRICCKSLIMKRLRKGGDEKE